MQRKLTDAKVKNAKPKDKAYKLADGGGHYLYVSKVGGKSFRYDYQLDKWATLVFGQYPVISLAEARQLHEKAYRLVKQGIDPRTQEKADKLSALPFSHFAQEAMNTQDLRESTIKKKLLKMQKHLFPSLDKLTFSKITALDLLNIVKPIADSGKQVLAKDLATYCKQTFNYALGLQLIENNPASNLSELLPNPKQATNFAHITDKKTFAKLLRSVDAYNGDIAVKKALQLLPLLILRPANIRFLKWSYIDFNKSLITIPANDMKKDKEHLVPLSTQAINILKSLKPLTGQHDYVFLTASGLTKNKPMSENTLNVALTKLIDEDTGQAYGRGRITSHGFRHSCSTFLNELKYDADAIELQLAHASKDRIRATYNKALLIDDRTKMMQEWADYLEGLKNDSKPQ